MSSPYVKSVSADSRIRFKSSKKRAQSASADVYRNYKGKTSASTREEQVHHPKRRRLSRQGETTPGHDSVLDQQDVEASSSTLAEELDLAMDRNASEIFGKFYREVWYLVRSLPEVLHHAAKIIQLFNEYMLSPESSQEDGRVVYGINLATTDILHLYSVLARDLRHEIHPFLHTQILPRILNDMLNPPPPDGRQPIPLDVSVVEAAFRTLSYIFRYDGEPLLSQAEGREEACLECMRQYYGVTLAHRRELVRRLAAETFAPLVRKIKTDSGKKRHLRRVLRALALSGQQSTLPSTQRLQTDAVDGISMLLYQVARGVSGKLHSKGQLVVECVLECAGGKIEASTLVKAAASVFLERLCLHLEYKQAAKVMSSVVAAAGRLVTNDGEQYFVHQRQLIELVHERVVFRNGVLLKEIGVVDEVVDLFVNLLDTERFKSLPTENKVAVANLVCAAWKAFPEHQAFGNRLVGPIKRLLVANRQLKNLGEDPLFSLLVRDLVPFLPLARISTVGNLILEAAASISHHNPQMAVAMVHALACKRIADSRPDEADDHDQLLFLDHAAECCLSENDKDQLLQVCMQASTGTEKLTVKETTQAAISAKATAFVSVVKTPSNVHPASALYKRVTTYLLSLIKQLSTDSESTAHEIVSLSVAIETLSQLSIFVLESSDAKFDNTSVLKKARPVVVGLVRSHPTSLWAMKCGSLFVKALKKVGLGFSDNADEIFERLIPNLHDSNHFRRLHSVEILGSFPKRPFVVDHADLDLTEDLDEEHEPFAPSNSNAASKGPTGSCNIMDTLLAIESTPIYFSKERYLSSLISRVEVLGRTGKLPIAYAEAAASHMLGLLHVKFAPIWPAAVRALVALSKAHENNVWPLAQEQISGMMSNFPYRESESDATRAAAATPPGSDCDPFVYYQLCVDWETSSGKNPSLFFQDIKCAIEDGRVSRHRSTDEATVLEWLWRVFEEAPQLLLSHSRTMIPMVLQFLHNQFFYLHPEDPDARELGLAEHVPSKRSPELDKVLDRGAIQQRLISLLKAFASINGPQQLFKHKLLFSIFLSLLSHPEATVANLALSCVLRFKPAYLMPYGEHLKKFYIKGKLREALLQFRSADEDGIIVSEHRPCLIPVLCRILFGRISARAVEGRSSKDTPSARRSAILSFVSSVCQDETELYSFVYLMVRPYIPKRYSVKSIESQDVEYRGSLINMIESLGPDECSRLSTKVHQGFLNTLEAVIAQLGHKVLSFVPTFVKIILSLCRLYEVGSGESGAAEQDEERTAINIGGNDRNVLEGGGSVRGLCFRRLAELFDTFGESTDFYCYSEELWRSIHKSLTILPSMAVKAAKAPALLVLLKTLSYNSNLIKMLSSCEEAIPSVLRCFARGSGSSVVDATLTFIENLLANRDSETDCMFLLKRHVGLLLRQFRDRFDAKGDSSKTPSTTFRRELTILCSVSDLIGCGDEKSQDDVSESLFSLLIPFLDNKRGCSDDDRSKVLRILTALAPQVSPDAADSHYIRLSKLLGPLKATAGITSKLVRATLAGLLRVLAGSSYVSAGPAVRVTVDLCAVSSKRVDELDYNVVIPALGDLCDAPKPCSWGELCKVGKGSDPLLLSPVVHCCFHLLFSEDGVVARSSFRALKALTALASMKSVGNPTLEGETDKWLKLLEGCIVHLARAGLNVRDSAIRRYFILILGDVARHNKDASSPNLHGDLARLVREDEPDLDFFVNITHVQVHRRARALQRLRKHLNGDIGSTNFGSQSLSHVLLPLALNPVYETVTKIEEALALEGIATAGAIARLLSWSKYNNILWTTLTQFHRHPDQETNLVGLLCSLIDGFHFSIDIDGNEETSGDGSSAVWRALDKRFIPKIEGLLVKEKTDNHGNKVKMLRPSIVLALLKLFKKLPVKAFRGKLPRILTVICAALKSRDSDARDTARKTLAKIAVEIDIEYLPDIVRELAITLTEGYQLHVRSAAIHAILLKLTASYKPSDAIGSTAVTPFDRAVPALMDLIQQDLFGVAQDRKEAEGSHVRYVKEAGGSKSSHSVELIASMIVFNPLTKRGALDGSVSSIHALVTPFLERLRTPGLQTRVLRQISDCLARIGIGLQRNPSVKGEQILPYVFSTLEPFVGRHEMEQVMEDIDSGSDSDDDNGLKPLKINGRRPAGAEDAALEKGDVVEWRPSTLGSVKTAKAAHEAKKVMATETRRVMDGASAPKMTGSGRARGFGESTTGVNDPVTISAVKFGLQLLGGSLKKSTKAPDNVSMLDPFVPLLTTCVCRCRDSDVVLLSLKCLGWLLRSELPSLSRCAKTLASKTLDLLSSSGAATSLNPELVLACFKMLTYLLNYDRKYLSSDGPIKLSEMLDQDEGVLSKGFALPLDSEQMQVLLSFLRASLVDSDHHNPAIGLVKAIMSRQYISAEFYDLMETLLELSVKSAKSSLREQSCAIIVSFLINYPLSEERLEQHLQQTLLNLKYEHADGRLSAISLVTMIVEKFPTPVLDQHCQMLFLPLALQLVNDDSNKCREAVANCIKKLLNRTSTNSVQSLFDYTERWSEGTSALQRMALQLYSLFIESKVEFCGRGDTAIKLMGRIEKLLDEKEQDWEVVYFALLTLEKMTQAFPEMVSSQTSIWQVLLRTMTNRHAWVKQVSARLLLNHLSSLDPTSFAKTGPPTFLVDCPGALYQVARNYCFQLGADEDEQVDDLVPLIVKSLTWTLLAMDASPHLCFDDSHAADAQDQEDNDGSEGEMTKKSDPALWLMTRLANIAKPRGTKRRQAVFKCFAAFGTFAANVAMPHLELMLTPLHRSAVESQNQQGNPLYQMPQASDDDDESQLVQEVLHLLEQETSDFIQAYAAVKKRALDKKDERKLAVKAEHVLDPQKSAQRRIQKQDKEKKRRKRRIDERRRLRGGVAKRRHVDPS